MEKMTKETRKLTYSNEMDIQDSLYEIESEDKVQMTKLHRSIVSEAVKNGWKGVAEFIDYGDEVVTNIYPNKETQEECSLGISDYDSISYGKCSSLIKALEEDMTKGDDYFIEVYKYQNNKVSVNKIEENKEIEIDKDKLMKTKHYKVEILNDSNNLDLSYIFYNLKGRPNNSSTYAEDNLEMINILNMEIVNHKPFSLFFEMENNKDIRDYLTLKDVKYEEVFGEWSFGVFEEKDNPLIKESICFFEKQLKEQDKINKKYFEFVVQLLKQKQTK